MRCRASMPFGWPLDSSRASRLGDCGTRLPPVTPARSLFRQSTSALTRSGPLRLTRWPGMPHSAVRWCPRNRMKRECTTGNSPAKCSRPRDRDRKGCPSHWPKGREGGTAAGGSSTGTLRYPQAGRPASNRRPITGRGVPVTGRCLGPWPALTPSPRPKGG